MYIHVHGLDPHKCLRYTATDTHCLCFAFAFVAVIRFGSEQAGQDEETAPEEGATHSQGLRIQMSQRVSFNTFSFDAWFLLRPIYCGKGQDRGCNEEEKRV